MDVREKLFNYLKASGLNKREINIYIFLFHNRRSSLSTISKNTKIPKTTTLRYLKKLLERNLVHKTVLNNEPIYSAENPIKIERLLIEKQHKLEKEKNEIEMVRKLLNSNVQDLLTSLGSNDDDNFQIKLYEGSQAVEVINDRSLNYADGEILYISNIKYRNRVYTNEKARKEYIPARVKKGIKVKQLLVNNSYGRELAKEDHLYLRETRLLPKQIDFTDSFLIYGDEVFVMINKKPYRAIIVREPSLNQTLKTLFNFLWELSTME